LRAVVQRVSWAQVTVNGRVVGRIDQGLLVYLGVAQGDSDRDVDYLASKVLGLRVFDDAQGKMNLDLQAVGGGVLAISQFTLLGDVRRGKRPSFTGAADPTEANRLYEAFCQRVAGQGAVVEKGIFQADMQVCSTNDGPVTIMLDSRKLF
jgi:D-aminoacyl-tRNA deacylase